ncbi:MAG: GrpB family protein [bacterium]|nr:GrpB family protein [bacterium]
MNKKLKNRIEELIKEEVSIVPYDPAWPKMFKDEAAFLREKLPKNLIKRVEHFGGTAVPGLSAKPIIDILVEIASLKETKRQIVPLLTAEGYEYFWRPAIGNEPPYYAWFIKRNAAGHRTHHIHMVEADSKLWDRLYFRDYLRQFPVEMKRYDELKKSLAEIYPNVRVAYT